MTYIADNVHLANTPVLQLSVQSKMEEEVREDQTTRQILSFKILPLTTIIDLKSMISQRYAAAWYAHLPQPFSTFHPMTEYGVVLDSHHARLERRWSPVEVKPAYDGRITNRTRLPEENTASAIDIRDRVALSIGSH